MSSRLPMGVGITVRGISQPPSRYSPEDASLASAAAPRTPDLGPRVATLMSARSREGGLARSMTSLRAALSTSSPASMTPPPTATTSGLKMFTNPARPTPSHRPASSRTESATSSPSRASSVTSSPSICRLAARRPSAESGCSTASSRARRPMAVPEARASRQPWLPQAQRGPVAWMVTCPSSPPEPCAPRIRMPCVMTPPPIPVPSVTKTRWSASLPTPNRNSPHAAAFPSFSTVRGIPIIGSSSSLSGIPSTARRFGEKTTLFSCARIRPGTARHTPPTWGPSPTSEIALAMVSTSVPGECGVGWRTSSRIFPSGVTTPAAILVPPTSTPTAFTPLPPVHYLELNLSRVPAAPDRVGRIKRSCGQAVRFAGHLRLDATREPEEVHALPDLPGALDLQAPGDEDRAEVAAPEPCEPLVPVEHPVRDAGERDLRVHLYGRLEDLRVPGVLRADSLVDACDEGVEVARVDREPGGPPVPAPLPHQVPDREERAVEVHVGLPRTRRAAVGAVGAPVQDRRRPSRGARDLARDQARQSPRFLRHNDLEVLVWIHLRHGLLDGVSGAPLALGVELVEERGDPQRLAPVVREEQIEGRTRVLYPPYGVDARPEPPPEVFLVQLPPHPRHPHERLDAGTGPSCGERLVHMPEAHRGERPVVPAERRDIHDGPHAHQVQEPAQAPLCVRVLELAGDGPGEFPGDPHPGQRIICPPELRVEYRDGGIRRVLGRDVVVRHDHFHPQLARQRHLIPIRDAAVGGHEEVHALGEEVAHVGLQQAIAHLTDGELDGQVVGVVREREIQHGGGGDAVGVVVPEDADALAVPYGSREAARRYPPRLFLRRPERLQRGREKARSALGRDAPVRQHAGAQRIDPRLLRKLGDEIALRLHEPPPRQAGPPL